MLKKIHKEIEDFTNNIKEIKECDELLNYMNNNISSSIKLLMSVSKTFSLYGRIMLFFIISLTGLLALSSFGMLALNTGLLLITLILFFLILTYIIHCKNFLTLSINNARDSIEKTEE